MGNRIIKESIRTSYEIDALTPMAEITFYRLLTYADDYGIFLSDPRIVKSELFPLKSALYDVGINCIQLKSIEINSCLNQLSKVGIIKLYTANSKPYGCFTKWSRHQSIRNNKPKHPKPDGNPVFETVEDQLKSIEINCNQLNTIAPLIQSNPIQSESNPNPSIVRDSGESPDDKSSEAVVVYDEDKPTDVTPNQNIKLAKLTYDKVRQSEDIALKATVYCYWSLKKQYPEHKTIANATLKTWYEPMRLLFERDKRSELEVKSVWDWVRQDAFWSQNILSTTKFREKYSDLLVRYRSRNKNQRTETLDDIEAKLEQMA